MIEPNLPTVETPLADVTEISLAELFAKDPLKLTDQDLTRIVNHMRASRSQWLEQEEGKKKAPKQDKTASTSVDISQLEIEI